MQAPFEQSHLQLEGLEPEAFAYVRSVMPIQVHAEGGGEWSSKVKERELALNFVVYVRGRHQAPLAFDRVCKVTTRDCRRKAQ